MPVVEATQKRRQRARIEREVVTELTDRSLPRREHDEVGAELPPPMSSEVRADVEAGDTERCQLVTAYDAGLSESKRTHAHAQENTINQNELLEVENGTQAMDGRATLRTGTENKELATVATQHRRKNSRG